MQVLTRTLAIFLTVLSMFGCTSQHKQLNLAEDLKDFVQDKSKLPVLVYTRSGAAELKTYHSFMVDPINVFRTEKEEGLISDDDINRLKHQFQQKMAHELKKAGLPVVDNHTSSFSDIEAAMDNWAKNVSLAVVEAHKN